MPPSFSRNTKTVGWRQNAAIYRSVIDSQLYAQLCRAPILMKHIKLSVGHTLFHIMIHPLRKGVSYLGRSNQVLK